MSQQIFSQVDFERIEKQLAEEIQGISERKKEALKRNDSVHASVLGRKAFKRIKMLRDLRTFINSNFSNQQNIEFNQNAVA